MIWWRAAALALSLTALPIAAGPAQGPAVRFDGTWDLTWQTRRGPQRRGYLVLTQSGTALSAQIHGRGSVRATGSAQGSRFVLRGSRMMVPYRLEGMVDGDRMDGALKALSVDRRFSGVRRPVR